MRCPQFLGHIVLTLLAACSSTSALAQMRVHDPSTIVQDGERYWLFHTGTGVSSLHSDNLVDWIRGSAIFSQPPEWVDDVVPGHRGHFWAPDVIRVDDRYLVYYREGRILLPVRQLGVVLSRHREHVRDPNRPQSRSARPISITPI